MIGKLFIFEKKLITRRFKRSRSGFTLLEVLVAALVVGLGFMAAAQLNVSALRTARQTGDTSTAAFLAESLLEDMLSRDYNKIIASINGGEKVNADGSPDVAGDYQRSWEVDNNSPLSGMKTVTVTVKRLKTSDRPVIMTAVINDVD